MWIWGAETFFEDGNGGVMTFLQNRIGGPILYFLRSLLGGGAKTYFGPKNNGFPGWCAGKFWPLPNFTKSVYILSKGRKLSKTNEELP